MNREEYRQKAKARIEKYKAKEAKVDEHMKEAERIQAEIDDEREMMEVFIEQDRLLEQVESMMQEAIDAKELADELDRFRKSGQIQAGAHESIIQQFNLQEDEEEEAPTIVQESAEAASISGIQNVAVGSG